MNILPSKCYQAQSEQLKYIQWQLFDEAELERKIAETRDELEALKKGSNHSTERNAPKQKPKRQPLPSHLRRVQVIVDVSDEDKQAMGEEWTCIGYETAEQLAVQQREYYVKVIKRKKYVRNSTESAQECDCGIRVVPLHQCDGAGRLGVISFREQLMSDN